MRIDKVIETSKGAVTFQGEFSEEEVGFLLGFALMTLVEKGALSIMPMSEETIQ